MTNKMNKMNTKNPKRILSAMLCCIAKFCGGCAGSNYQPVVMLDQTNMDSYAKDIQECRMYANQRPDAVEGGLEGGAIGAGVGAVVGGVLGSFDGKFGQGALAGGIISGVLGGVKSAIAADKKKKLIIIRCLQSKGYNVLAD
jgi:outer membrane lipoprotein SlyB